jgi:hypothetical protein
LERTDAAGRLVLTLVAAAVDALGVRNAEYSRTLRRQTCGPAADTPCRPVRPGHGDMIIPCIPPSAWISCHARPNSASDPELVCWVAERVGVEPQAAWTHVRAVLATLEFDVAEMEALRQRPPREFDVPMA